MKTKCILTFFLIFLFACSVPTPAPTTTLERHPPTSTAIPTRTSQPEQVSTQSKSEKCVLAPFIAPTMPAIIPETTKLDETTGLHMTGKVQVIDLETYRLAVTGKVDRPLSLSLDDLRCMPKITATSDLTCYGVFNDSGTWSGVPIRHVLELAGVQIGAKNVALKSADDFSMTLTLDEVLPEKNFLAYEMEGKPLPILHGFPLRAVFPNEPGGRWVKWLVAITVE